jgi:predicted TPR repeat methyltransferase
VALEPYWAEAWASLGDAERAAGNTAPAIKAYELYLTLAPRSAAVTMSGVRRRLAELRQAPAPAAPAAPAP